MYKLNIHDPNDVYNIYQLSLKLNIPARYIINNESIFEYIKKNARSTLTNLYETINNINKDIYTPNEFIYIYLHSFNGNVNSKTFSEYIEKFQKKYKIEAEHFNIDNIMNFYKNEWLSFYTKELESSKEEANNYIKIESELFDYPALNSSPMTIESSTFSYKIKTDGNILSDLFNNATTSYILPYIQYNSKKEKYYKIYAYNDPEKYLLSSVEEINTNSENIIYINMWISEKTAMSDIRRKETFEICTIEYSNNECIITLSTEISTNMNQELMIKRLNKHFPDLEKYQVLNIEEKSITGYFVIYDIKLYDEILSYMMLNNNIFKNYLYIEETTESLAEKKRLNIHYKGIQNQNNIYESQHLIGKAKTKSPVWANLIPVLIKANDIIEVIVNDEIIQQKAENPIYSTKVRINKTISKNMAMRFLNVLTRLMYLYNINLKTISSYIITYIPDYDYIMSLKLQEYTKISTNNTKKISNKKYGNVETKINKLKNIAGELFIEGYARICQVGKQPIAIDPDEQEDWINKRVLNKNGNMEVREIMQFPINNETESFLYVCPGDVYPYPGLIENKIKNQEVYPYLPCCFKKPNKLYHDLLSGKDIEITKKTTDENYLSKTNKIQHPGGKGLLSNVLTSFFSKYNNNSGIFYRYGVPKSINSFIHCVALAVEDENYLQLLDDNKEEYVSNLRQNIFDSGVYPELCKQECYDLSLDDIKRNVIENEIFFDPLIYFRLLEEYYDCNIYIFSSPSKHNKTNYLELPRNKIMHIRPPRTKKHTVCILRHYGTEVDNLSYPQCELIIEETNQQINFSFNSNMNKLIYKCYEELNKHLIWSIKENLECRLNLFSSYDFQKSFENLIISNQIIDNYGKCRFIVLLPQYNNKEKNEIKNLFIFIQVNPTAPLNCEHIERIKIQNNLPDLKSLIDLFGNPTKLTVTSNKKFISGAWFLLGDDKYGFYCPCIYENSDSYEQYEKETDFIVSREQYQISPLNYLRNNNKISSYIIQIFKYLYLIDNKPDNIENFVSKYIIIDKNYEYNINDFKRILPYKKNVRSILKEFPSNLIKNGKFIIKNDEIYDGIVWNLKLYQKDISYLDIDPLSLRELDNFYLYKDDIKTNNMQFLLLSEKQYNKWRDIYIQKSNIQQRLIQNLKNKKQTTINNEAFTYIEPFILYTEEKYYLVQNVIAGDIDRALNVAYIWNTNNYNIGYTSPKFDITEKSEPVNKIYYFENNKLTVLEDNSVGNENFLMIYKYQGPYYAALLPLLE